MTREPFMNPRTGAIHFEEEESNNGTSDMVDSSNNPVDNREYEIGEDDFDLLSPIAQLEALAKTLERVYTLSTRRETELEQDEPLPTLGEYCLIGFHTVSVDAEHAAKRLREAISRCYSAAQEIDEREYDRIGD
ncbi:hypothetical protein CMI37_11195 [Candidatus Pacearchaeota archaeon]|nr:hypothetical protein [Candidatus Pacearchaeota archaeon]